MEWTKLPYPAETITCIYCTARQPERHSCLSIQTEINVSNKGCEVSGFHLTQFEFVILCEYIYNNT